MNILIFWCLLKELKPFICGGRRRFDKNNLIIKKWGVGGWEGVSQRKPAEILHTRKRQTQNQFPEKDQGKSGFKRSEKKSERKNEGKNKGTGMHRQIKG